MLLAAFVAALFAPHDHARAAERVALVIGNSSYANTAELKNPRNDAEAISKLLSQFGFLVIKGIDVDQFNFKTLVRAFTREIKGAKLALFFYAGHGLQVGQGNFLLPTDAELKEESDLDFETVQLRFILQQMERERRTNIVLLDACRDNPFSRNLARNMGTRSTLIGRGLAAVETGVGTFVGFATQPGNVALDGVSDNSPFTEAIINHLAEPGLDIGVLMRRVREDVIKATDGKQVPWSNSSLVGDNVILNTTKREIAIEPAIVKPQQQQADNTDLDRSELALELTFWNTVKNSDNPALLQSYVDQYPDGTFAGLARAIIQSLENSLGAAKTKAETPAGKAVAEPKEQKVAALPPPADNLPATGKPKPAPAATAKLQAPKVAAPETSPQPDKKVAALPPGGNEASAQAQRNLPDITDMPRKMQAELRRLGCIAARPDGIWGPKSRRALGNYARHAGLKLANLQPDLEILLEMQKRKDRVCPIVCSRRHELKNGRCRLKTCPRGQILTRKGNCIAKAKRKQPTTTTRRKTTTQRKTTTRQRNGEPAAAPTKKSTKPNMFDGELDACPRCVNF